MSGEKHGRGVEQSWQMLDAFANLGIARFDLTQTDVDGRKQAFAAAQPWPELRDRMPALLESATSAQRDGTAARWRRASAIGRSRRWRGRAGA